MRVALLVGAAVAALLGACGDDEESPSPDGEFDSELAALVAPARPSIQYVDVDAVREQLELPADAEFNAEPTSEEPETLRLSDAASVLVPFASRRRGEAVADAIDSGAISAGATPYLTSRSAVAAVRTSQSFDEIAAGLEEHG